MKIETREDLEQLAKMISEKTANLVEKTISQSLPISYLTIFSHTPQEYEKFIEWLGELRGSVEANNGLKFLLSEPLETSCGPVAQIRIRKPDVYRSQLGCADFTVKDYLVFKSEIYAKYPSNLRLIERSDYEMFEFFDFENNDVLAYVVSK